MFTGIATNIYSFNYPVQLAQRNIYQTSSHERNIRKIEQDVASSTVVYNSTVSRLINFLVVSQYSDTFIHSRYKRGTEQHWWWLSAKMLLLLLLLILLTMMMMMIIWSYRRIVYMLMFLFWWCVLFVQCMYVYHTYTLHM